MTENPQSLAVEGKVLDIDNSALLSSRPNHQQKLQISVSELHLWRNQAQAIGRSPSHLHSIDRLLQMVQKNQRLHDSFVTSKNEHQLLDVSKRTYQIRVQDNEEFIEQAFVLFGRQQQQSSPLAMPKTSINRYQIVRKLHAWWLHLKNHLQRLKTQLQHISQKIAARLYQLLK